MCTRRGFATSTHALRWRWLAAVHVVWAPKRAVISAWWFSSAAKTHTHTHSFLGQQQSILHTQILELWVCMHLCIWLIQRLKADCFLSTHAASECPVITKKSTWRSACCLCVCDLEVRVDYWWFTGFFRLFVLLFTHSSPVGGLLCARTSSAVLGLESSLKPLGIQMIYVVAAEINWGNHPPFWSWTGLSA